MKPNPHKLFEVSRPLDSLRLEFDPRNELQCRYGCQWFGKKETCPPGIPHIAEFKRMLSEFSSVYVIGRKYPYDRYFSSYWRTYSTNEIHERILEKETELFRKGHMYAKGFIGGSCKLCGSSLCLDGDCRLPGKKRSPLEATGIHILALLKELGAEYQQPPRDYFWRVGAVFY